MKRALGVCLGLFALGAIHCIAAVPAAVPKAVPKEEPSAKPAADVPQPVIPERKLTFDISEEEQAVPLRGADRELLEQRYVATFQLVGPRRLQVAEFGGPANAISGYMVAVDRHGHLLFGEGPPTSIPALVKSALSEMPQERLPSEDVVSLLAKKGYPYYYHPARPADPETKDDRWTIEFMILAPTPERAKELVQGVLSFYDYGVFYPLQKEALAVKRACERRLEEDRASLQKARDERTLLQKQLEALKEYEDITKEALVNFTTQLRLIAVDLVGIKARIDACNKILADRKNLSPNRIDQVETVKVTAEIELVGLAARKEAIEEIVKKGGKRKELSEQLARASSNIINLETQVSRMLSGISHYEGELTKCRPYPVVDGKTVIRRIKWASPAARGSAPPAEPPPTTR